MAKLEKEIQAELIKIIRKHPEVAFIDRANSGKVRVKGGFMQLHKKGTPDLIGFTKQGKFIGIELKRPDTKNKAKPEQLEMQGLMSESNCIYGISYDEDSLKLILDKI